MKKTPTKSRRSVPSSPIKSGPDIISQFWFDRSLKRAVAKTDWLLVVRFTKGQRTATLTVSRVAGHLMVTEVSADGRKEATLLKLEKALNWLRHQLAASWFDSRLDNDKGWSLLLGMCEGFAQPKIHVPTFEEVTPIN